MDFFGIYYYRFSRNCKILQVNEFLKFILNGRFFSCLVSSALFPLLFFDRMHLVTCVLYRFIISDIRRVEEYS